MCHCNFPKISDASVKRYRFNNVIERKRSYLDLSSPVEWLEKTRLVSRCYPVDCEPQTPLSAYRKENFFKLFLFDIGLLGHMRGYQLPGTPSAEL